MPKLYIVAGCNGAGKTTGSISILPEILNCREFVNADMIASGLSPFNAESVAFAAGRIMLQRLDELLIEGTDFAFETTLSSRSYIRLIKKAREYGYRITLLFFWLESPDMARDRVAARVSKGGHNIPSDIIGRRYYRGIKNLYDYYLSVCDNWIIVNNTATPVVIASCRNGSELIFNRSIWNMIKQQSLMVEEPSTPYLTIEDDFVERVMKGLRKGFKKLVLESAQRNESLVVLIDDKVQNVPAKNLLHLIEDD